MANTVAIQTIADTDRHVIVKVYLASDGAAGELSAQVLVDASALTPIPGTLHLRRVSWSFSGFTAILAWDATTDDVVMHLADIAEDADYSNFGGIPNPKSTGVTGDLVITTTGFSAAGDAGTLVIECTKQ